MIIIKESHDSTTGKHFNISWRPTKVSTSLKIWITFTESLLNHLLRLSSLLTSILLFLPRVLIFSLGPCRVLPTCGSILLQSLSCFAPYRILPTSLSLFLDFIFSLAPCYILSSPGSIFQQSLPSLTPLPYHYPLPSPITLLL